VEKEEFDVSTRHETGYVIVLEPVDAFQIPASGTQALLVRPQFKFKVFPVWFRKGRGGEGRRYSYICPFTHCTSSTMSKLLCTMNWFMCRASSRKRAMPSPPCFEVPNSCSKRGLSFVPTMQK